MSKLVFIVLLVVTGFTAQAQGYTNPLHPVADKVWRGYYVYNKNRLSMTDMLFFLESFPKTKDDFIFTFDPDDQKELYKVHNDYMLALEEIGNVLPDSVLKITVGICKQMKWSSGVSDRFQHAVLTVAADHAELFVTWAYTLKRKELLATVSYLADVENKPDCAVYRKLISNLHEIGAYNLEGMLQRAKTVTH